MDPIDYVVNLSTGEAIRTSRTKILLSNGIVRWSVDYDCFVFNDKYKKFIIDENIDNIISDIKFVNKKTSQYFKSYKSFTFNEMLLSDNLKKLKYVLNVLYVEFDDFSMSIDKNGYIKFFHSKDDKFIEYKQIRNEYFFSTIIISLNKIFKDSVMFIINTDYKPYDYFEYESILFKMINEPVIVEGYLTTKIIIKNRITGTKCIIKSGFISNNVEFSDCLLKVKYCKGEIISIGSSINVKRAAKYFGIKK